MVLQFTVSRSGSRVYDLGFRVKRIGFGVKELELRGIPGSELRV
jgi:hypothetical protein